MKQHSQIIEKENQAIEKILEIINIFISDVEKPIPSQNSLDHINWYKNSGSLKRTSKHFE
ncbi:hypothetical protein [endosymbiont GvMRE of Glomus versiforme]|uniref:hypothetical protein n=1 Tax=endosymbiont GvMRE of Glomus versiforme TaxID=2039283 RepID=UPI000EC1377B|nr:hypothetical protein [endosymbiont GvMRE of Glomus versiforme]RHZ36561.1 hypothetical protein GvMRE_I2g187 [endosymbiont GvMRE of Glomus versiforme]